MASHRPRFHPALPLAILSTALGLALGGASTAAEEPVYAPLVQRERTTLILVDVRVVDAQGNPVHGLTQEDFLLEVDRKAAPIASFDEIVPPDLALDEPAEGVSPSPSHFVFFFDNIFSDRFEQRQAAVAADGVLENLRDNDSYAVVALGRRLGVLAPMARVGNRRDEKISDLLLAAEVQDDFWGDKPRRIKEIRDLLAFYPQNPERARLRARAYATQEGNRIHHVLGVTRTILIALEPIRERKILLYFSGGIPQYPGADYLVAAAIPDEITMGTRTTLSELEHLFRDANSARTSIYPVDASGLSATMDIGEVTVSGGGGGGDAVPGFGRQTADVTGRKDGLISLGINTGGRAIRNTNAFDEALAPEVEAARHYYLLGFAPISEGDGRYHRIEVKLKNPGLRVQSREGFVDFTSEQADERQVLGSFMLPEMFRDVPAQVEVIPLERRGRFWYAEAQVRVPVHALDRIPMGSGSGGQLEVGTNLFRGARLAARFDRALTVRFPAGAASAGSKEIVFQQPFRLKPGDYVGVAVARDGVSGLGGGARAEFVVPKEPGGIRIVLGRLPGGDILSPAPESDRSHENPRLLAAGRAIVWAGSAKPRFEIDDVVIAAYLLEGVAENPPPVTHRILQEGKLTRTSQPTLEVVGKNGELLAAYEELPADSLPAGSYTLEVTVGEGPEAKKSEVAFEILPPPSEEYITERRPAPGPEAVPSR